MFLFKVRPIANLHFIFYIRPSLRNNLVAATAGIFSRLGLTIQRRFLFPLTNLGLSATHFEEER